jgi:hypothetical protein
MLNISYFHRGLFRFSRVFPRWFPAGTLLDADYENPDLGGKDGSEGQSRKEVKIGVQIGKDIQSPWTCS